MNFQIRKNINFLNVFKIKTKIKIALRHKEKVLYKLYNF